jgi:hypothetical protein
MCLCFTWTTLIFGFEGLSAWNVWELQSRYSKLQVIWYLSIWKSRTTTRIFKENAPFFIKLLRKQSYTTYMFTCHAVVLPDASSSSSPICRCHYSSSDVQLQWWLLDFVIAFNISPIILLYLLRRLLLKNWSENLLFWFLSEEQKYQKTWTGWKLCEKWVL